MTPACEQTRARAQEMDTSYRNAVCSRAVRFLNDLHGETGGGLTVDEYQTQNSDRVVERFVPVPAYRVSIELCMAGVLVGLLIAILLRNILG